MLHTAKNQIFTVCNQIFAVCLHSAKKPCVLIGQKELHADHTSKPLDLEKSNGSHRVIILSPRALPLFSLLSSTYRPPPYSSPLLHLPSPVPTTTSKCTAGSSR